MHNVIMNTPLGFDTDHVNRKRSDNRKSNLRVVSHADNMLNRTIQSNNRHGYKGVSPTPTGRWAAKFRGKYLGTFDTPQEASKAYSTAFNFA